jgi:hypothetical protein
MFNPIFWYDDIEIDEDLLSDAVEIVKDMGDELRCPTQKFTTTYFIHDRPEYIFQQFYHSIINDVLNDTALSERMDYHINFWMQIYDSTISKEHSVHDHFTTSEIFSWVHFVRPTQQKCFFYVDTKGNKTYPDQYQNRFIVFPSWLQHGVDPLDGETMQERVVIAGNVLFDSIIDHNRQTVLRRLISNERINVSERIPL